MKKTLTESSTLSLVNQIPCYKLNVSIATILKQKTNNKVTVWFLQQYALAEEAATSTAKLKCLVTFYQVKAMLQQHIIHKAN